MTTITTPFFRAQFPVRHDLSGEPVGAWFTFGKPCGEYPGPSYVKPEFRQRYARLKFPLRIDILWEGAGWPSVKVTRNG